MCYNSKYVIYSRFLCIILHLLFNNVTEWFFFKFVLLEYCLFQIRVPFSWWLILNYPKKEWGSSGGGYSWKSVGAQHGALFNCGHLTCLLFMLYMGETGNNYIVSCCQNSFSDCYKFFLSSLKMIYEESRKEAILEICEQYSH